MAPRANGHTTLTRRALRVTQTADFPLYLFSLTAAESLQIADEGKKKRAEAEKELTGLESSLKTALQQASARAGPGAAGASEALNKSE